MQSPRFVALTTLVGLITCVPGLASPASSGQIYRCGRVASDHQSPDCVAAAAEEAERLKSEAESAASAAAAKRRIDRASGNLLARFPDEVTHTNARQKALVPLRASIDVNEARILDLRAERQRLEEERAFYPLGREPPKLILDIGGNEAQLTGRRQSVTHQREEIARVNALYDAELKQLRTLWVRR